MSAEIKIAPEAVDAVKGIIAQAYERMAQVAQGIGAHSGTVPTAYHGSGTATAMETYDNLGRSGQALANALDALSQDLGLTANTGRETDDSARTTLHRVVPVSTAPDQSIAAYV